jgi:hypothetical protein
MHEVHEMHETHEMSFVVFVFFVNLVPKTLADSSDPFFGALHAIGGLAWGLELPTSQNLPSQNLPY